MAGGNQDWMPGTNQGKVEMAAVWLGILNERAGDWGIPAGVVERLDLLTADASDAQAWAVSPAATTAIRERRNRLVAELAAHMRDIKRRYFHMPPLVLEDYPKLGLPIPDRTITFHIEVPELVEFEFDLRGIREVLVDFWVKGSANKAKPAGYDGAVIVWEISDEPLVNPEKFTNHKMASRTPFAIKFEPEDRGKTVYVAAVWQNARGILGDWSDVQATVVP